MRERSRSTKVRITHGFGKSLMQKASLCMQAKRNKEFIDCFVPAVSCSAFSRKPELHHAQQWLGRTNIPHVLLPAVLYAENDAIWYGIFLWLVGLSSTAMASTKSLCILSLLASRAVWETKGLAVQTLLINKHWYNINTYFVTNPKHFIIWGAMRNINSIPVKIDPNFLKSID